MCASAWAGHGSRNGRVFGALYVTVDTNGINRHKWIKLNTVEIPIYWRDHTPRRNSIASAAQRPQLTVSDCAGASAGVLSADSELPPLIADARRSASAARLICSTVCAWPSVTAWWWVGNKLYCLMTRLTRLHHFGSVSQGSKPPVSTNHHVCTSYIMGPYYPRHPRCHEAPDGRLLLYTQRASVLPSSCRRTSASAWAAVAAQSGERGSPL
jgi:hypothetical protein